MTPSELAQLHFDHGPDARPWSAQEYADLLSDPKTIIIDHDHGFALGQIILDEAELLIILVQHTYRGLGSGRKLLQAFEIACKSRGADRIILEVSHANTPARALYSQMGYTQCGLRKNYYHTRQGAVQDAVIMAKNFDQKTA